MEGRGSNATALETDIGTYNGVIHVIDTFLGIPHLSIADKMREDPLVRYAFNKSPKKIDLCTIFKRVPSGKKS